jgi:uncharacterized protein YndB with AHSA1/START domain
MKKITQSILINAPAEKVWEMVIGEDSFKVWCSPFGEGTHFKGDWSKGSKILFLGHDEATGNEMGMVASIAENTPYTFLSIEHKGYILNGVEDFESEAVTSWLPAFENYTFKEVEGGTEFIVEVDSADEHYDMMEEMWPKALRKLKEISEA